jgi:cell wall-associated NlpC family hydrolase
MLFYSCGIFAQESPPIASAEPVLNSELKLRYEITDFAKTFEGTKYRYAGRTPNGFDCSGFISHIMKEYDYRMGASSAAQEKQGKEIESSKSQPGDLVFFRRSKSGRVFHVAMVVSNNAGALTIVHSTSSRGVVIDEIKKSAYWRSKYITARDIISERKIEITDEMPLH